MSRKRSMSGYKSREEKRAIDGKQKKGANIKKHPWDIYQIKGFDISTMRKDFEIKADRSGGNKEDFDIFAEDNEGHYLILDVYPLSIDQELSEEEGNKLALKKWLEHRGEESIDGFFLNSLENIIPFDFPKDFKVLVTKYGIKK